MTIAAAGVPKNPRSDAWAFEAIRLERGEAGLRPRHLVVISVEPDLLGYSVHQSVFELNRRGMQARRRYTVTLAEAIVLAGEMAHERLREGFVFQSTWQSGRLHRPVARRVA